MWGAAGSCGAPRGVVGAAWNRTAGRLPRRLLTGRRGAVAGDAEGPLPFLKRQAPGRAAESRLRRSAGRPEPPTALLPAWVGGGDEARALPAASSRSPLLRPPQAAPRSLSVPSLPWFVVGSGSAGPVVRPASPPPTHVHDRPGSGERRAAASPASCLPSSPATRVFAFISCFPVWDRATLYAEIRLQTIQAEMFPETP